MIAALLLAASAPRLIIRVETPARPLGIERGRRWPPRMPASRDRTWAIRAVLIIPF